MPRRTSVLWKGRISGHICTDAGLNKQKPETFFYGKNANVLLTVQFMKSYRLRKCRYPATSDTWPDKINGIWLWKSPDFWSAGYPATNMTRHVPTWGGPGRPCSWPAFWRILINWRFQQGVYTANKGGTLVRISVAEPDSDPVLVGRRLRLHKL